MESIPNARQLVIKRTFDYMMGGADYLLASLIALYCKSSPGSIDPGHCSDCHRPDLVLKEGIYVRWLIEF